MNSPKICTAICFVLSIGCLQRAVAQSAAPEASPSAPAQTAAAPLGESPATEVQAPVGPTKIDDPNSVVKEVVVSGRAYYHGSGFFALAGALGGLVASSVWKDEPDRIAGYVKQENISIGAIVKTEFERQFEQSAEARRVLAAKGPGKFTMGVGYGITSVPFSEYRPYLAVSLRLVDDAGVEKWKRRDYVGSHGNAKSIPYPAFFKSAKDFTDEFEVAANELVTLLIKDFSRQ